MESLVDTNYIKVSRSEKPKRACMDQTSDTEVEQSNEKPSNWQEGSAFKKPEQAL